MDSQAEKRLLERIAGLEAELEVARADETVLNRAKDLLCAANVGVVHPGYDGESTVVFEGDDGGAYEGATLAAAVRLLELIRTDERNYGKAPGLPLEVEKNG